MVNERRKLSLSRSKWITLEITNLIRIPQGCSFLLGFCVMYAKFFKQNSSDDIRTGLIS